MASPAEAVREALIAAEVAVYPGVKQHPYDGTVQCFVGTFPDQPDDMIYLKDVQGRKFGRDMRGGGEDQHRGVSMVVRSLEYDVGSDIVDRVCGLFEALSDDEVKVRDKSVRLLSIYRVGTPIHIGNDGARPPRETWGIDVRVVMGQSSLGG